MPVIPHHFSLSGFTVGAILLCFEANVAHLMRLAAGVRSLNLEHVSPELIEVQEICRSTPAGRMAAWWCRCGAAVRGWTLPAIHGRRPWARKPDAGSQFAGILATLLLARKLDDWPEAGPQWPANGLMDFAPCLLASRQ